MKNGIRKIKIKIQNSILYPSGVFLEKKLLHSVNPILLIGTPVHKNLGDHLIADNELSFLQSIFLNRDIFEIPTDVFFDREKRIVRNTPEDAVIIITGGGWMGDLWPDDEYRMQKIISDYNQHRIVIFPQTMFYRNRKNNKIEIDAKRTYDGCKDLTLLLRERRSYDYANHIFGEVIKRILLVPDMGLYRNYIDYQRKDINKVGICLREDREKESNNDFGKKIIDQLQSSGYKTIIFSTMNNQGVPIWCRKKKIMDMIKEINSYDCVITDRLHGMIFSVISGTKCIVYDNSTHKVYEVYSEWLHDNPNIKMMSNYEISYLLTTLKAFNSEVTNPIWQNKIKDGFKTIEKILLEENR